MSNHVPPGIPLGMPLGEPAEPSNIKRLAAHLIYDSVNRFLSNTNNGITQTRTPDTLLFDNLALLSQQLAEKLDADQIMVLRQSGEQMGMLEVTSALQTVPSAYTHCYFSEDAWNGLGEGRGVEIFPNKNSSTEKYLKLLHLNPRSFEIALIRIGDYNADMKFLMVILRNMRQGRHSLAFQHDLREIFDLLALRLHEIYGLALYRLRDIQYDRDRSHFIQDIMHQLTGSLSGISTNVERLMSGQEQDFEGALRRLYQQVFMFQGYTQTFSLAANTEERSILDVYGESFKPFTADEWVDLIQQHCDFFVDYAHHYGIAGPTVIKESFANFPPVCVKPLLFGLVFFNLIDNATKYSARFRNAPITVFGEVLRDGIAITIVNHGIGLTPDAASSIFGRYVRSIEAKHHEPNGTGVGLYLSREIVEHHEGTLMALPSIPSALIPGAEEVHFTIHLPVTMNTDCQSERDAWRDIRPTILCVEDEDWRHQAVIATLKDHFQVELARTSAQALNILDQEEKRNQIKVILLDIRLSGGTDILPVGEFAGVQLAEIILHERGYDIPIIGITAHNIPKVNNQLLTLGVKEVLNRSNASLADISGAIRRYIQ